MFCIYYCARVIQCAVISQFRTHVRRRQKLLVDTRASLTQVFLSVSDPSVLLTGKQFLGPSRPLGRNRTNRHTSRSGRNSKKKIGRKYLCDLIILLLIVLFHVVSFVKQELFTNIIFTHNKQNTNMFY